MFSDIFSALLEVCVVAAGHSFSPQSRPPAVPGGWGAFAGQVRQ